MKSVCTAAGTLLLLAGCQQPNITVQAPDQSGQKGLTISGTATIRVNPTLVILRLGVGYTRLRPALAKADVEKTITKIVGEVKKAGVAGADVQTSSFTLRHAQNSDGTFKGWACGSELEIRVKDVEKAGVILEAALDAGANQVASVEYTVEELQKIRAQARDEATQVVKNKAEQYAKNFSVKLSGPHSISESSPGAWSYGRNTMTQSISNMTIESSGGSPDQILSSGSVAVTLTVNVTYSLN